MDEIAMRAHDIAAELFVLRIDGDWHALSQFGVPYWTWANGYKVPEGHLIPVNGDPDRLLALYREGLVRQHQTHDVLVWRTMPRHTEQDGKHVLRVRWHFWNKENL